MRKLMAAGLAILNPIVCPPRQQSQTVYQIEPSALALLKLRRRWVADDLAELSRTPANTGCDAMPAGGRISTAVPCSIAPDRGIDLTPGEHNRLIKAVIKDFAARFVPGGVLVSGWGYGRKIGVISIGYFSTNLG